MNVPIEHAEKLKRNFGHNAPEQDKKNAFELTRQAIGYRMLQLLQLPLETMSNAELQKALTAISNA